MPKRLRTWPPRSFQYSVGVTITDNEFTQLQGDGIRLGGVQDTLIEGNYFHDFLSSDNGLVHDDMIQVWSKDTYVQTKNLTIINNVFEQGEGEWSQTIFIGNEKTRVEGWTEDDLHENIIIENNYIHNSHLHGVFLQGVDGARVANNTIVQNEEYVAQLIADAEENGTYINAGTYLPRIRAEDNVSNVEILDNKVYSVISNGDGHVVEGNGLDGEGADIDVPVIIDPVDPEEPVVEEPIIEEQGPFDPAENLKVLLVDSETDEVLAEFTNGGVLEYDLSAHPKVSLVVSSDADGLESVSLDLNGETGRIENFAPYALFGDSGDDFLGGIALNEGNQTLSVAGYSQNRGQGEVLFDTEIVFSVVDTGSAGTDDPETPVVDDGEEGEGEGEGTVEDALLSLVDADSSPLETATYDPETGDLHLIFSYDKLTASSGAYADARHIDAFVFDGTAYEIEIHSADGPRDSSGRYIYDETTMQNEFIVNIGTGLDASDAPLEFTFTDRADGTGELFSFEIDDQQGEEPETPVDPPVDPMTGTIFGSVFVDKDGDGTVDFAQDDAASGATVHLLDGDGAVLDSTQVTSSGDYQFLNLAAGDYIIEFPTEFEGNTLVAPDQGAEDADSDVDPATGRSAVISLDEAGVELVSAGFDGTEVEEEEPPAEVETEEEFTVFLVNAETDEILTQVTNGQELSFEFGELENVNLAVYSESAELESISLLLNGADKRIENVEPYALFGDDAQGDFHDGIQLGSGEHTLSVNGYTDDKARGELLFSEDFAFSIA